MATQTNSTNRYTVNILKKIGETVLEWSITDIQANTTIGRGESTGYAAAVELVRKANQSGQGL